MNVIGRRRFTGATVASLALLPAMGCVGASKQSRKESSAMQKDALWSDPNEGVPISPVGYARRQRASQRAAQAFTHHAARGAPEAPSGSVSQRWQVDLGPDLQPRELLAGPRGVVACGMSGYQGSCRIVRWSGEVVGDVPREAPGVALDRRGAHLLTTHEGKPTVYSLLKGR